MDAITVFRSNIYKIASHGAVAKRNVGRASEKDRERSEHGGIYIHEHPSIQRERERESLLVTREPIPKHGTGYQGTL
jgi:hypothetical protein